MADIVLTPPSTGAITQYYGNGSERGIHSGNDYAYSSGGKIHDKAVAMDDGTVIWADDTRKLGWPNRFYFNPDFDRSDNVDQSAGIAVVLQHWYGMTTYCHLYTTPLNNGDVVKRGQYVGTVGETGFSYGKHLHAELILNDHDFNTNTGGRADLNKYMVANVAPAIVKDWFDMATEADIRRIIREEIATLKPGVAGQNFDGEHYKQFMENLRKLITRTDVMDTQALHLLKRPVHLIDPSAKTGKITGTTTLATKANWEAYNFQKALNLLVEIAGSLNAHVTVPEPVNENVVAQSVPDAE